MCFIDLNTCWKLDVVVIWDSMSKKSWPSSIRCFKNAIGIYWTQKLVSLFLWFLEELPSNPHGRVSVSWDGSWLMPSLNLALSENRIYNPKFPWLITIFPNKSAINRGYPNTSTSAKKDGMMDIDGRSGTSILMIGLLIGCRIVFGIFLPQVLDFLLVFFPGTICLVFATVWN